MCRVNLHATETGLTRQARCPRKLRGQLLKLASCQFSATQTGLIERTRTFGGVLESPISQSGFSG